MYTYYNSLDIIKLYGDAEIKKLFGGGGGEAVA